MTRDGVLNAIKKKIYVSSIRVLGDEKDKSDAFYIIMNTQQVIGTARDTFHGIRGCTLVLLREAEIPFEIIRDDEKSQVGEQK